MGEYEDGWGFFVSQWMSMKMVGFYITVDEYEDGWFFVSQWVSMKTVGFCITVDEYEDGWFLYHSG